MGGVSKALLLALAALLSAKYAVSSLMGGGGASVACLAKGAGAHGSNCYKVLNAKSTYEEGKAACEMAGYKLAAPRSKQALQTAYTTALIQHVAAAGGAEPECVGPTWIAIRDTSSEDAGSDGSSVLWEYDDGTGENIVGTGLENFWLDGFPLADDIGGGVTVNLDCVAAVALDASLFQGAVPPNLTEGGMMNLVCSASDLSSVDPGVDLPAGFEPPAEFSGIALPSLSNLLNASSWCPLCQFAAPSASSSSLA